MSTAKTQQRISFSTVKNRVPYPDLLEVQLKSFRDFFQMDTTAENRKSEGLYKVFQENFPITDTRNNFVLEFIDYYIDPPRYSIEECLERGLTYSVPLKAKLKLYCTDDEHEDFGVVVQDVYFGTIPYMTERGTFVINGAERVIVSQLHRSPGVFFGQSMHTNGTKLYSARIIPFKGSWIEFATDINNVMYAYIDRKKKLPVTTLLRAIGYEADQQILEIFDLADEVKVTKANLKKAVGRKLAARVLSTWVEDFVDEDTGEVVSIERNNVIVDRETVLQEEHVEQILESGAKTILLHKENLSGIDFSIIYNTLQKDPCNSEKEAVVYIYRQLRASEPPDEATAQNNVLSRFFSTLKERSGGVAGVLDGVMDVWGRLLVGYGDIQGSADELMDEMIKGLGGGSGALGSIASWLGDTVSASVAALGLEPCDLRLRKPVLTDSANIIKSPGSDIAGLSQAQDKLRSIPLGVTDPKALCEALEYQVERTINGTVFTLAEIPLPGGGSIPLTVDVATLVGALGGGS